MPTFTPDVPAYFARIGYTGRAEPTLECLQELQRLHPLAIPFESLDVAAGRNIPLDGPAVERKLIRDRRGGYCFEQNGYLLQVLTEIGFLVRPFMARVVWNLPPGVRWPRTHLILSVEIEGRSWLFDVGFGGVGISTPIAWEPDETQNTWEGLRVHQRGHLRVLQAPSGAAWSDVYEIDPYEAEPSDWEAANWFTSAHPNSRFRQNLIVSRALPDGRCSLLNHDFTLRRGSAEAERRRLEGPDDLLAVLNSRFGLSFPAGTRFGPPGSPWPS